jgi:hypothetical protein
MIDAIIALLRATLATIGVLALADPSTSAPLVTTVVVALAIALLVVAMIAARADARRRPSVAHPTRRIELVAPLAQSDPDAAGHVRRRGPGQAATAA